MKAKSPEEIEIMLAKLEKRAEEYHFPYTIRRLCIYAFP